MQIRAALNRSNNDAVEAVRDVLSTMGLEPPGAYLYP